MFSVLFLRICRKCTRIKRLHTLPLRANALANSPRKNLILVLKILIN